MEGEGKGTTHLVFQTLTVNVKESKLSPCSSKQRILYEKLASLNPSNPVVRVLFWNVVELSSSP